MVIEPLKKDQLNIAGLFYVQIYNFLSSIAITATIPKRYG